MGCGEVQDCKVSYLQEDGGQSKTFCFRRVSPKINNKNRANISKGREVSQFFRSYTVA
jgi:hypothetical protein